MIATVENGRLTKVRGDRDDPLSLGYACFKGLQAPEYHDGPGRLLKSLLRRDGVLAHATSAEALAVAGDRLAAIVERHGTGSVGLYMGTQSLFNTPMQPLMRAFAAALGTPRLFATMTIDQSAKWIAEARLGAWHAGPQAFDTADTWMMVGSNPAVSMVMGGGANHVAFPNPIKTLRAAKARGLRLIVIDPRRSETAAFADIFLQPRPGTDALIAASLLQVVLREGWQDEDFCGRHVAGVEALSRALAAFAPERTSAATGLDPQDLRAAARLFAYESRRGMVGTGTGTDMGQHSNLAEHLFQALNVVCGRFPRTNETVANLGVLTPLRERRAEVHRVAREWESGPRTLRHGFGPIRGTMMSSAIADEILSDDPARMRALICIGGNPAFALPDAARTFAALDALELLVVVDPRLTATARRAHVVLAPTLQYERADHTAVLERLFQQPYAHATAAIVHPPAGSDVVEETTVLLALADRLGLLLTLDGIAVTDTNAADLLARGSAIPLRQVADHPGGLLADVAPGRVQPPQGFERFDLIPADVANEIASLADEATVPPRTGDLVLIVRRHREVMNTTGTDMTATATRFPGNTAFLHPVDLRRLGIAPGDVITIARMGLSVRAHARPDEAVGVGCVSLAHCWESDGDAEDATNTLVSGTVDIQSINGMPVMTGLRVDVARVTP